MRQTTVLVAQLTVSAGIRAPMAHLADEVFFRLSEELTKQGVPQKVIADMFGFALRSYQRKVARLRQGSTDESTTLWEGVLAHIEDNEACTRADIVRHFSRDDPNSVRSVLRDLAQSGLVQEVGRTSEATFRSTPSSERAARAQSGDQEGLQTLVWLDIGRHPSSTIDELSGRLSLPAEELRSAVERLIEKGQVQRSEQGTLSAQKLFIPFGAETGWETAVFDHFRATCASIAAKLRLGPRAEEHDTTGGATFSFDICPGHPMEEQVMGLLRRTNQEVGELWDAVEAHNAKHALDPSAIEPVTFYFGQCTTPKEDSSETELEPETP